MSDKKLQKLSFGDVLKKYISNFLKYFKKNINFEERLKQSYTYNFTKDTPHHRQFPKNLIKAVFNTRNTTDPSCSKTCPNS